MLPEKIEQFKKLRFNKRYQELTINSISFKERSKCDLPDVIHHREEQLLYLLEDKEKYQITIKNLEEESYNSFST